MKLTEIRRGYKLTANLKNVSLSKLEKSNLIDESIEWKMQKKKMKMNYYSRDKSGSKSTRLL